MVEIEANAYKLELVWSRIIFFAFMHFELVYAFVLPAKVRTYFIAYFINIVVSFGVTAGAHRYFTHRAFKANQKLKILLMLMQTMAAHEPILTWVRDHRVHHKYTETSADPHNAKRGFFFAHIGWLMCKKHDDVRKFGAKVDMSDLTDDPVIKFQRKYFMPMVIVLSVVLPTYILCLTGETFYNSFHINLARQMSALHIVFMVNSVAHFYGNKPYDKHLKATENNFVSYFASGEGHHNFHHCYPWDYKTSETFDYRLNFTTAFIDFFAWLGWATELKTVPDDLIRKRILKTGDGSHKIAQCDQNNNFAAIDGDTNKALNNYWGFGDGDLKEEHKKYIKIL